MKLRKRQYGLRQPPNSVWNCPVEDLRPKSFTPTTSDPCVYEKGRDAHYIMPTLFVDYPSITGPPNAIVPEVRQCTWLGSGGLFVTVRGTPNLPIIHQKEINFELGR